MPNKSFSLYNLDGNVTIDERDQLVLEIGKSHIACILKEESKQTIAAFELFLFKEEEALDFKKLFNIISADSKLLASPNSGARVFINNPVCIPVPIFKFNKDIAEDYLNLVYANDPLATTLYDNIAIEPGIMNIFRVNKKCLSALNLYLPRVTFHHTYSNIIKSLVQAMPLGNPAEFMSVNFFNAFIIVTVFKDNKLNLIQTFIYETHEDVLYHLLNISERFKLRIDKLILKISGMIDLDFGLYREMIKYFKEVSVENVSTANISLNINEHPLHYFTPFFNLAT